MGMTIHKPNVHGPEPGGLRAVGNYDGGQLCSYSLCLKDPLIWNSMLRLSPMARVSDAEE